MVQSMEWKLKALTDIWTGDTNRRGDRLIPTSIIGSLRWWYEVLVRGLDGAACDPTVKEVRCPDPNKKPTDPGHHCVACELFGCTGWARKFRLMILDEDGNVMQGQITAGTTFVLRFIPLRPIREEEWCLLDATLRLIAEYGAMGGKTVFKPSDESGRQNAFHHQDYGLIELEPSGFSCERTRLEAYVQGNKWRKQIDDSAFAWASLKNFWCVKGRCLERQGKAESTFNAVLGRKQDKSVKEQRGLRIIRWSDLFEDRNDEVSKWLAGSQQESKKVFSFKHPVNARRTFGFVKPSILDFDSVKSRLGQVWGDLGDEKFLYGDLIIEKLFEGGK